MLSALRRVNSQVLKYHLMLEPLEFKFAKDNAKEKDKTLPGPCILVWEKAPRISKSKPTEGTGGKIVWPPAPQTTPLQLIITMYKKDGKFLPKKTSLKARVVTNKGEEKSVGKCEIDVADYCSEREISHPPVEIKMGGDCVIKCRIHSRPLPTGTADDDISMMSGLSTVEEVSTADDWAAGFGKNKPADRGMDSESDKDDDDSDVDDEEDFGGFAVKVDISKKRDENATATDDTKKTPIPPESPRSVYDAFDADDFADVVLPNVKDDPTIITPTSPVDVDEVNRQIQEANAVKAELKIEETNTAAEVTKQNEQDQAIVAALSTTTDHTQCNELINKYTHQIELLTRDGEHYKQQLHQLKSQHTTDVEKFQAIVQLSQTSLNKMQDVVTEYKNREQTFSLQISALQKKLKDNEKVYTTENKKLTKEHQILTQDVTILQSKLNTLRETLKHKEEHEQQLLIQMKTTGNTESILLSEKAQLQQQVKDLENDKTLLKTQEVELKKELEQKTTTLNDFEKKYEKLKVQSDEYEVQLAALKASIQQEKEINLDLKQQIAQFEHNLAIKQEQLDKSQGIVKQKEEELIATQTSLTSITSKYNDKTEQLKTVNNQNDELQQQVSKLQQQNGTLLEEKDSLVKETQRLTEQYKTLQDDLSTKVSTQGEDMNTLQSQIKLLNATIATLEEFKANALNKEKQSAEQLSTLQQDKTKLQNQVQHLEKDNNTMQLDKDRLEKQVNTLSLDLTTAKTELETVNVKYNEIEPKLLTLEKKTIEQQTIITTHVNTIAQLNKDKEANANTITDLRNHIVELEHDNEEFKNSAIPKYQKEIKQLQEQLDQKEQQKERQVMEITALSAALEALKNGIAKSAEEKANANDGDIEDGETISSAELQRLRDEIAFLTTTLDKRTVKIEKLNAEIERLHEDSDEMLQLRQQMEEDFQELEHERDELDSKLNILTTKYDLLLAENNKLKASLQEVNKEELKQLELEYKNLEQQYHQVKERCEVLKKDNAKLKEELNTAEQLIPELNNKLSIAETKLHNSEVNCKSVLDKSTELAQTLNTELTRAHLENRALMDRINTFESLSATISAVIAKSPKKEKIESGVVRELIAKIDYYQSQLAEADETLLQTKQTWKQTSDVLSHRILDLEQQIVQLKNQLVDLEQTYGQSNQDVEKTKQVLSQQQAKQEKLAEVMSKFEIQLIEKKVQIADLQKERNELQEKLQKSELAMDNYENTIQALKIECEQLRETLAIVNVNNAHGSSQASGQSKKQGKKKRSNQQNNDDFNNLDDADF